MANTTPVARVSAIQGQAFAKDKNGELRALHIGDVIFEGDVLVTAAGSRVELAADDRRTLVLSANETLTVDAEVMATLPPDATDSALQLANGDVNKVVKAINEGGSLDALLDETAAGDVGGGADGGSSFVRLLRITEGVDPLGFEFDTVRRELVEEHLHAGDDVVRESTGGTILDNDTAPTIRINDVTVNEDAGTMSFTVTLDHATTAPVTFNYATSNGTVTPATAGVDYTASTAGANGSIAAGQLTTTITVAIADDFIKEGNETLNVTLSNLSGNVAATGNDLIGLGTITDDDPAPSLSINDVTVNESAGTATFTVTLSGASGQAVSVDFGTSNGTATAGSDYTAASGIVTFAPGETSKTITIAINNDGLVEPAESFTVTLTNPTNATLADATGVGSILNDDIAPIIDLSGPPVDDVTLVGWNHNTPANTVNADQINGSLVSASTAETVGAGLTRTFDDTLAVIAGVNSANLNQAITNNDYLSYSFTTAINLPADTAITQIYNADWNKYGGGDAGYKIAVLISSDNFATSSILIVDRQAVTAGGVYYTPVLGGVLVPYVLAANTTYEVRSYLYDATAGTVYWDDFQIKASAGAFNYSNTFTEDGPAVSIAGSTADIIDSDSANMTRATITLTNAQVGDVVTVGALASGITSSVSGSTITLSGSATQADYEAAIRGITFSNTSDTPNTTNRIITVTVFDGDNLSNTATSTIAVLPTNDAPETKNVTAKGNEDTLITVTLSGSDPDGTVAGYVINSLPTHGMLYSDAAGTLAITAGALVTGPVYFHPDVNWNSNIINPDGTITTGGAPTSFQYSARDNSGATDATPATATITVAPLDDGTPAAAADSFVAIEGSPIIITAAQLMANDTLFDRAQITASTTIPGLTNNLDGTWTYKPPAGTAGKTPSFNYTLTDDQGQTSVANVSIKVYATSDDLVAVNESALSDGTGGGVVTVSGNLLSNDPGRADITAINSVGGVVDGNTTGGTGNVDTDARAGYIGVDHVVGGVIVGNVVVDATGAGIGNYTYTLTDNANHSTAANNNSLTSAIAYTTTGSSTSTGASLQVTIVDDRPQAFQREVQVTEAVMPNYKLVLVLDTSRSMDLPDAGGVIQSEADNGSITITTRIDMAKRAMTDLISQYYEQASTVSVQLVTFGPTGALISYGTDAGGNPITTFNDKATALAAINSISTSTVGGTNYEAGLTAATAAFGTPSSSVQNVAYFISDGAPTGGDTPTATTNWNLFTANNNIQSYALGIGTGVSATTALNTIHNVDADASGSRDTAIIVPDLNDLSATLTNSVPVTYGGNVVGGSSNSLGSALGADGGYIQTLVVPLDTDANSSTAPVNVTFSYNGTQISWGGGFPAGSPFLGDTLTLSTLNGFRLGTLNFNFATGDYTYYTGTGATEGTQFSISFVARDGDGDVTPATNLHFSVVDGQPIARPDFDSLSPNGSSFSGNVITGLGTDSGLPEGTLVTDFTARGAGADTATDGATVTSIVFQGQTFSLINAVGSTTALGGSYTVSAGTLSWTHETNGSSLAFNSEGYYNYVPPAASIPNPPLATTITVNLRAAPDLATTGLTITGVDENGETAGITYYNPFGSSNDGAGVTGRGVVSGATSSDTDTNNRSVDGLETMVFSFNALRGVENIIFTINADNSNVGDPVALGQGRSRSLTYNVYHIDGHLLGTFVSQAEGTITLPGAYSNVGSIEVQTSSDTQARISGISYQPISEDTSTTVIAPVEIAYTLTDADSDTSNAVLTLSSYNNAVTGDSGANTLIGTGINDQLFGKDGDDTLSGLAGHDLLSGGTGADSLDGGDGSDQLFGGIGNDVLIGGAGNDHLTGGGGNDQLTGGAGADVFVWSLADRGAVGSPAVDTINAFDNATAGSGGDVLDLRDLLQGEYHTGSTAGSLANYLHFTAVDGNTTVQISSGGGFASGFNAAAVDQQIVLQGVDLTNGSTLVDQTIIQDLLNRGKLHTD